MQRSGLAFLGMWLLTATAFAANGDLIVDGKLGIGTASPTTRLGIQTTSTANSVVTGLRVFNSGGGAGSGASIMAGFNNSDDQAGLKGYHDGGAIALGLMVGSNERLTIKNSGDVGIGTVTPRGRLDIGTYLGAGKGIFAGNYFEVNEREAVNNAVTIGFNAYIAANDGTFIPSHAPGTGMVLSMVSGGNSDLDFWGKNWAGNNTPVGLDTFTHVMRLSTSGKVGVGTTTPAAKLDVAGGILGRDINGNSISLTSDARFKKNILAVESPLNKVQNINGHSYEWKTDDYQEKGFPTGRHYGVIAQEIEKVLPEVVSTAPDGSKAVAYTELIPVLIEAIKEQQKRIETQQQRIEVQQAELEALKRKLN